MSCHCFYLKWHDIQPSMVIHTQNLCSAFNPSKVHTHRSEHTHTHTHTPWTHTRSSGQPFYAAAPGEQLGVRCLAQGHLSRDIEGGESAVHSLPPPTSTILQFLPFSNPQPLDYKSNSLTIRPRLPLGGRKGNYRKGNFKWLLLWSGAIEKIKLTWPSRGGGDTA